MSTPQVSTESRIAVLVDCDNTNPEIFEYVPHFPPLISGIPVCWTCLKPMIFLR